VFRPVLVAPPRPKKLVVIAPLEIVEDDPRDLISTINRVIQGTNPCALLTSNAEPPCWTRWEAISSTHLHFFPLLPIGTQERDVIFRVVDNRRPRAKTSGADLLFRIVGLTLVALFRAHSRRSFRRYLPSVLLVAISRQ
jgi:hypothetical protein